MYDKATAGVTWFKYFIGSCIGILTEEDLFDVKIGSYIIVVHTMVAAVLSLASDSYSVVFMTALATAEIITSLLVPIGV